MLTSWENKVIFFKKCKDFQDSVMVIICAKIIIFLSIERRFIILQQRIIKVSDSSHIFT